MLSRVADNLYWLSRYLERAEHTARVLDLTLNILLEQRSDELMDSSLKRLLESLFAKQLSGNMSLYEITQSLAFDRKNPASITFCIAQSRENARQIREQISSEMFEQLNMLYHKVSRTGIDDVWESQTTHGFFREVKEGAQLFQGLTDSTMIHNEGWHFLQLGRYIERASYNAHFLDVQFRDLERSKDYPLIAEDFMDWVGLLKCFTAFEAYCNVYTADLRSERIIEFLLLNAEFPHSIRFSVDMMENALKRIDSLTETKRAGLVSRLIGKLKSDLSFSQVDEIIESGLGNYLEGIQKQNNRIHDAIYAVYIGYPVEKALT